MSPQRIERLSALCRQWVDDDVAPAFVTLLARRGVVVHQQADGRLTSRPSSPPVSLDTIFPLCSLSKPLTACAVMLLVEDGLVGLNTPLRAYIPEFTGKDEVMVHHLLTHTSGLVDNDVHEHAGRKGGETVIPPPEHGQHPELHKHLWLRYDAPLSRKPGAEMSYESINFDLLGELVRRVAGVSLASFTRKRLFDPLGMKDTSFALPESLFSRTVDYGRYGPKEGPPGVDAPAYRSVPYGAGGAFSTVTDMAIFGQMLLNLGAYGTTRIFSPTTVIEMTRNQIPGISARYGAEVFPEASWGFGWNVRGDKKGFNFGSLCSNRTFSHIGYGVVLLWVDPAYELVGCAFGVNRWTIDPSSVDFKYHWPLDLYMNAATAAVVDL